MSLKITIRKDLGTGYQQRIPRLKEIARLAVKSRLEMGLPKVYRNELCVKPSHFIHEYADGRKFLIELDPSNSKQTIIKTL